MKTNWMLALLVATVASAWGETPAPSTGLCEKSVSFAITSGGQPVAAIPSFAAHWIGSEKHQQRYRGLCFAQSPDPRAKNYIVVFSTQQESFNGLVPTVLKYVNSAPVSENNALSAIYGQMWHFASNQPAAATTTTLNLLRTDISSVLFVRVYDEQGVTVSQLSLRDVSGWLHTREKLFERILEGISGDSRQQMPSQVALKTSLPVYYVNCDVPIKSLASQEPALTPLEPAATPVQVATLEFWSSPAGADVYIDGGFVGKTPSSFTVSPGEHTITMRKQNFGTWQRKLQITDGKRKIAGYLEQKLVTLGFGLQ